MIDIQKAFNKIEELVKEKMSEFEKNKTDDSEALEYQPIEADGTMKDFREKIEDADDANVSLYIRIKCGSKAYIW